MGILDTFFIMFEADASDLDEGLKKSDKKADDLTRSLKKADAAGNEVGKSMGNLLATAGGALMAALSAGAMMAGIQNAANYADSLGKLSDALGVDIEDMSAWSDVVSMAGGSAESFKSSVSNLTMGLQELALRGTSRISPFFEELNIQLRDSNGNVKTALELLPEMADSFSKMSRSQALGYGQKMGLDQGTIMLLQQGRREVEEQIRKQKELGVVTKEQAKQSAAWNDTLSQMGFMFRGLWLAVGQSVLPAFQAIVGAFTSMISFFRKHSDFITGLFITLGTAVMVFLVPPLITAAGAAIAAMAPFLLIGAIVAFVAGAFALLYDDVMNFMDGNDSMIGEIFKKYPAVKDIVFAVIDAFKGLFEAGKELWGLFGDLFTLATLKAQQFWSSLTNGIDEFKKAFPELFAVIEKIGHIFDIVFEAVKKSFTGVIDDLVEDFKSVAKFFGIDVAVGGIKEARAQVQAASATALNNINSNAISNTQVANAPTTVNVGTVTVNTQATDAEGVSKAVGGELQGQIKRATSNYDDGVLA